MDAPSVTTDQLAATIRARVLAKPTAAITCAPGVEELATLITDRLPYIAADDAGAILLHVGCYIADAMQIMRGPGGLSADAAAGMAADIVALAGERLYTAGLRTAHERRNGGGC